MKLTTYLSAALFTAFAATAQAQETTAETAAPAPAPTQAPKSVLKATNGEWNVTCLETPAGENCSMTQILKNPAGNPLAEIQIVKLPEGGDLAAGITVLTPLKTLLAAGLTKRIDNGQATTSGFQWCDQVGCFSKFGFNAAEVEAIRNAVSFQLAIRAIENPQQPVVMNVSLTGFTASWDALTTVTVPAAQ